MELVGKSGPRSNLRESSFICCPIDERRSPEWSGRGTIPDGVAEMGEDGCSRTWYIRSASVNNDMSMPMRSRIIWMGGGDAG